MAVKSILSAAASAACAMFREAVAVTSKLFAQMKGAVAGLQGAVKFAGNVGGNIISTPGGMGGAGPPGKGTARA